MRRHRNPLFPFKATVRSLRGQTIFPTAVFLPYRNHEVPSQVGVVGITAASRRLSANFCSNLAGFQPQADPMKKSLITDSGAFRCLLAGVAAGMLLACQVSLAQPAVELPGPSPSASGRVDSLSRELAAKVASSPQLVGAWVDIEIDDQAGDTESADLFVFRRTLDATKADAQRSEIDRIIRSLLPAGGFRVDAASDRLLPLGSLLGSLRELTSRDVRFEGCKVLDAGYRWDMTTAEAVDLGQRAIYHATHRDAYSGGVNNLYHVQADGWKKVWSGDVNELHARYQAEGTTSAMKPPVSAAAAR